MRVALTGAATGIGAEVATKLRTAGHHVTGFDIADPGDLVDRWVPLDLGAPDAIAQALAAAEGPYEALINNAGLPPRPGEAARVLQVNYFGLVAFLDGMLGQLAQGAAVVNTASRAGAMWRDNLDQVRALMGWDPADAAGFVAAQGLDATRAYNLTKEAVIVLTMARCEAMLARGLRMNSVSPAAVSTGILDDFKRAFGDRVAQNLAKVGRAGLPGEVADVICFMAGPESHWIKGQDLVVDGGMSAIAVSEQLGVLA